MAKISSRGRGRQAPAHGGALSDDQHRLVIAHSLECEAKENLAYELTVPDGCYLQTAGVSPHSMSDPGETVWACDTDLVGYHVGPKGNPISTGGEVTGRAAWTRAQWLQDAPNRALQRQAKALAQQAMDKGFAPGDYRWLSLAEVRDGKTNGFCYHYDISRALGGTDHYDPGSGYPADIQMERIRWYAGVQDYWGTGTANRPSDVTPLPGGTSGGAETATDWFGGASLMDVATACRDAW